MHQITLTVSQNVLMNHINEHSCQNMCSKFAPSAHTHTHTHTHTHDLRRSRRWSVVASILS